MTPAKQRDAKLGDKEQKSAGRRSNKQFEEFCRGIQACGPSASGVPKAHDKALDPKSAAKHSKRPMTAMASAAASKRKRM